MKLSHPTLRMPELDGIRGLAALMVVGFHLAGVYSGFLGVDIFFVLSGFLITSILLREYDEHGEIRLKTFYLRRAIRLWPVLTVFLLVYGAVALALNRPLSNTLAAMASVEFYYSNWLQAFRAPVDLDMLTHTWSLSVEEHFYVVWPLAIIVLMRHVRNYRLIIGLLIGAIGAIGLWRGYLFWITASDPRCYCGTDTRADALLSGCLVAFIRQLGLQVSHRLSAAALIAILCLLLPPGWLKSGAVYYGGFTLITVAAPILLLWILQNPQHPACHLLRHRALIWVGQISYSLYLWHWLVLRVMQTLIPNQYVARPVALVLSFLVSALSFYAIERPCLRLKNRLTTMTAPASTRSKNVSPSRAC